MVLYAKCVNNASVGATAGTFDNVGSIQVRNDAKKLLGFWVEAAPTVNVAAVAFSGILKISSNDLNMSPQTFICPPFIGGSPATNVMMSAQRTMWIPMVKDLKGKEVITIDFSQNLPTNGTACSVVVCMVYDAKTPSSLGTEALKAWPYMAPIAAGAQTVSQASVTTVAETAVTTQVFIPSWATEIVGIAAVMVPNLMTAGEEVVGSVTLRSTLTDFDSQEWPFVFSVNPPLGTPVGSGIAAQEVPAMAMSFPLDGKNNTVNVYVKLNVAITTGDPIIVTLYYR